jgi:hypothetical protein
MSNRITDRDQNGIISQRETEAAKLHLAVEGPNEIVKIERIHLSTGEVLWILQRILDTQEGRSG